LHFQAIQPPAIVPE